MKILSLLGPMVHCLACGWCGRDVAGDVCLTSFLAHVRVRHATAAYVEYRVNA